MTKLESIRDQLAQRVERWMEPMRVPGVAVGILHGDEEQVHVFGVTSIDNPLEVTDTTLFQIGSTTKTFTATALMRKVEDGSLDLDAPLQRYLPDFALADADWTKQVTPRHLLTHTGGWEGDFLLHNPAGDRGDGALQAVVGAMPSAPLQTPPGSLQHYNNSGFSLAGRLLEVLTGMTYERAIADLVFEPLGLKNTFLLPEDVMTRRFAVGHVHTNMTDIRVAREWAIHRSSSAAGAIAADVRDQLVYARFHLGDGKSASGETVLEPKSMAAMQSPQVQTGEPGAAIGLSWMLDSIAGSRSVAHGGGTNGQISTFQLMPDHDFALVILTNADSGGLLNQRITAWLHTQLLELEPAPPPKPIELPAAVLEEYVGTYSRDGMILTIRRAGDGLEFENRSTHPPEGWEQFLQLPPAPIAFVAPDRAIVMDGITQGTPLSFIRDGAGALRWLRAGGRIHGRQR